MRLLALGANETAEALNNYVRTMETSSAMDIEKRPAH